MALCYMRLLCRRSTDLRNFRNLYTCSSYNAAVSKPLCMTSTVCETHDEKNTRLKRPMSPHLTIYQVQLTSVLSITHRITGAVLSSYVMALGMGHLLIPGGIPCLVEMITNLNLPVPLFFLGKTMMAFCLTYHTYNGFRHLLWDMGKFLTIKGVYSTGYAVTALSVVTALVLAAL
ncbi:succinate dehydrogenase cytochrome b560 subunit, mitochondrial [Ptiloglossa arizonensis]|uniref:succinate dehydrogenase cytochrome b560 subunit, mitochondrial n=1 Tax=Ptiloglossa arizonensis TaxID=3350558 RepID=UPI003FA08690